MRSFRQTSKFFLFFFLVIVGMFGCEETESTIGFSGLESKIETVMVDTFTVRTSTVLLDSIYSSGTNRVLVGKYQDPALGELSSSSYFQIAPTILSWSIQTDAVFDSVSLLLTPDGYYYGDTTRAIEIGVNRLSEDITGRTIDKNIFRDIPASYFFREGAMYNTSENNFYENKLGNLKYTPSTNSSDSISIRLSDEVGNHWFDLAKNNDQQITNQYNFISEFKGFRLSATNDAEAVIGFDASKIRVRIYYHVSTNSEYLQNISFDIPVFQSALQYNQIQTNYSSTSLSSIERGKALRSELTGNESFIQGGSGLLTKIEFPYLNLLSETNEHLTVLQSILTVNAVQEFPQNYLLPSQLALYYSNDLNIPTNVLASEANASNPNVAALNSDSEFNKYSNYSFSINAYASSLIRGESYFPKSLFLGLTAADMTGTTTRLRVGSKDNPSYKIKLQVYYSRYQTSQ